MAVRRWIKVVLWVAAIGITVSVVIGSAFAIAIWRHTSVTSVERPDAEKQFEQMRARFPGRKPLVEIRDPGPIMTDIRVHRAPATAPRQPVKYFQVLLYDGKNKRLIRSSAPVWWMRFSGNALLARLGLPMGDLALTEEDIERYGPGIIADFSPPGGGRILVWTE